MTLREGLTCLIGFLNSIPQYHTSVVCATWPLQQNCFCFLTHLFQSYNWVKCTYINLETILYYNFRINVPLKIRVSSGLWRNMFCFSVLLYTDFTDWILFFPRILCAQWWWRVLPVLLCDSQRGNPGSQHAIPVSCQQSFSGRAADCGGWMQLWHPGGHHQGWLSWGTACLLTALLNI